MNTNTDTGLIFHDAIDTIKDYDSVVIGGFFFAKRHDSIRVSGAPALIANNFIMRRPRKWYHIREWYQVFSCVVNLPHG